MKIDRINRIYELLEQVHHISIDELCDTFKVSKNTIRRDIAELDKKGLIQKVYGGILLAEDEGASVEPLLSSKGRHAEAQKTIARLAAERVEDGDVIYIDSGATAMQMISYLTECHHLTIVTASLHVINAASAYRDLNVIATGGSLFLPAKAFVGPQVRRCLSCYNITKVFLTSSGISLEHGATDDSLLECEVKRCLIEKPCRHYLLIESSKFDVASLKDYCALKDLDSVITDRLPSEKYQSYFEEHEVELITPKPAAVSAT